jgi:hypothetical protein
VRKLEKVLNGRGDEVISQLKHTFTCLASPVGHRFWVKIDTTYAGSCEASIGVKLHLCDLTNGVAEVAARALTV